MPAILWSSFNGRQKGAALADVLTGAVHPSGHLPFTWYADQGQLPAIGDYAIRPTATTLGRTCQFFTGDVTYPFGHGLSYTSFRYSRLRVDRQHGPERLRRSCEIDIGKFCYARAARRIHQERLPPERTSECPGSARLPW